MYRVIVKNSGKYNNVVLGARYCFTKRSIIDLVAQFMAVECECKVEKLVRIHHDIFCWSDVVVGSDIWSRIYDTIEEMVVKKS